MPTIDDAQTLAAMGAIVLAASFVFNRISLLQADSGAYLSLHFIGAFLFCCASWLLGAIPFIALTAVWTMAMAVGLIKIARGTGPALPPPRPGERRCPAGTDRFFSYA